MTVNCILKRALCYSFLVVAVGTGRSVVARADSHVYRYRVEDRRFGEIGTYVNRIESRDGGRIIDVTTTLSVTVRLLGIPIFREDAQREEHWIDRCFTRFHGVTILNGHKIEVRGVAEPPGFLITSSRAGTVIAPASVHPSNPWARWMLDTKVMMSTDDGKVTHVRVVDAGITVANFDGGKVPLHKYFVDDDKHHIVWFDPRGVPVAFETPEHGSLIRFVLMEHELSMIWPNAQ